MYPKVLKTEVLPNHGDVTLSVPEDAVFLCIISTPDGKFWLRYLGTENARAVIRTITISFAGMPIETVTKNLVYIDSFVIINEEQKKIAVFDVFEKRSLIV